MLQTSTNFINIIKFSKDVSAAIEVVEVKANRDCSHVTAHWESNVLNRFVKMHWEEARSFEESFSLAEMLSTKVSAKLQRKEGHFRTSLMRKMTFRRVPRVFFRAADNSLGLLALQENQEQQSMQDRGSPRER